MAARSTRLCTARPGASGAGRDPLSLPAFAQHGAELLTARELAQLSMASTRHRRAATDLARLVMERQHGLCILDGGALANLHALERLPDQLTTDLRRRDARRVVERGSPLCTCYVGGRKDLKTRAQEPPAQGDAWAVDVCLRRGRYLLALDGWTNPAHGIVDLFWDGLRVGRGFDWCGEETAERRHTAELFVRWTGAHRLLGQCCRSNAARDRATRFWVCLASIQLKRMG